jgi:molybdenum cofactor biosynthesis enzyme MoaA
MLPFAKRGIALIGSSTLQVAASGLVTAHATGATYRLSEIADPLSFFRGLRREHAEQGVASDAPHYAYIAADTTHNCNLRCRFCPDDFSQATRDRMSEDHFQKLMAMAELAANGMLFLSCLYEPFLHPRFTDLLRLVPPIGREKAFFTTNLSVKRFKPDDLAGVAEANIGYVNVSVDSLHRETYEKLRVNADYDVFSENLKNLAAMFRNAPDPPKLRFISMALRSNYSEILDLARIAREEYGVAQYEVRLPFSFLHAPTEFAAYETLTAPEWARLEDRLAGLGQPVKVMTTESTARYYPGPVPGLPT